MFSFLKKLLGRGGEKTKAPGGAIAPTAPRYFHPLDVMTYKCRRCGIDATAAARTPCRNAPTVWTPLPAEQAVASFDQWTDSFGPLSSTFRVPEPPPEDFTPGGGTFGGGGASASWDTDRESAPSSSSTPESASPSSESNSGGSDGGSTSSSFDSSSGSSSGDFGGGFSGGGE